MGLGDRAQIEWKGIRGLLWCQLFRAAAFGMQPPDVLIIHLGGNDLAKLFGCPVRSQMVEGNVSRDEHYLVHSHPLSCLA